MCAGDDQDRSDFARYTFDQRWVREPDNPYPQLSLSHYRRLTTAYLEWDFTPEAIELIKAAITEAGCEYVPFSLFAEPEHYQWRALRDSLQGIRPAAGTLTMKREDLWSSLFDYE